MSLQEDVVAAADGEGVGQVLFHVLLHTLRRDLDVIQVYVRSDLLLEDALHDGVEYAGRRRPAHGQALQYEDASQGTKPEQVVDVLRLHRKLVISAG